MGWAREQEGGKAGTAWVPKVGGMATQQMGRAGRAPADPDAMSLPQPGCLHAGTRPDRWHVMAGVSGCLPMALETTQLQGVEGVSGLCEILVQPVVPCYQFFNQYVIRTDMLSLGASARV